MSGDWQLCLELNQGRYPVYCWPESGLSVRRLISGEDLKHANHALGREHILFSLKMRLGWMIPPGLILFVVENTSGPIAIVQFVRHDGSEHPYKLSEVFWAISEQQQRRGAERANRQQDMNEVLGLGRNEAVAPFIALFIADWLGLDAGTTWTLAGVHSLMGPGMTEEILERSLERYRDNEATAGIGVADMELYHALDEYSPVLGTHNAFLEWYEAVKTTGAKPCP